jgi:hypothetical protein
MMACEPSNIALQASSSTGAPVGYDVRRRSATTITASEVKHDTMSVIGAQSTDKHRASLCGWLGDVEEARNLAE